MFEAITGWDENFHARFARRVNEEPDEPREKEAMGVLRSLRIEKGQEFQPNAATLAVMKRSIHEAHAGSMDSPVTYRQPYRPRLNLLVNHRKDPTNENRRQT